MIKKVHVFRLKPKEKLMAGLIKYCQENKITSGIFLSVIGSLNNIELGFLKTLPGHYISKHYGGPLEIVNGTGTIALKGSELIIHLHLTISNEDRALGGHLIEGEVFSTAEVVIGELDDQIERRLDDFTGLNELS